MIIKQNNYTSVIKPPNKGNILELSACSIGYVESALVYNNQIIVTFKSILYDYTGESDEVVMEYGIDMNLGNSFKLATDSFINQLNSHISYKNVRYNKYTELLIKRLTSYYFINDRILFELATDNGSSIHPEIFNKGNYISLSTKNTYGSNITNKAIALLNSFR